MSEQKQVQLPIQEEKKERISDVQSQIQTAAQSRTHPTTSTSSLNKLILSEGAKDNNFQNHFLHQNIQEVEKPFDSEGKKKDIKIETETLKAQTPNNKPLLRKYQALGYDVPGHEVKVSNSMIKQTPYLWEWITGLAKRKLSIFKGYIYCLWPQDFGYIVVGIWNLQELYNIKIWQIQNRIKLTFKDSTGKNSQKEFLTINTELFKNQLRKQLLRMGRILS